LTTRDSESQVPLWFERKFDLSFPAEMLPNICARLRGTPARLEEALKDCPRERLIERRQEKWSIQEHAGHLLDLESLWRARLDEFLSGADQLSAADLKNRKTHEANHNARNIGDLLKEFRCTRLDWLRLVEGRAPQDASRTLTHPRLQKPMRLVDHLYFVAEHDDHHLARIWEMRR
jgi:uncharacterized damage-inducible protein DinB